MLQDKIATERLTTKSLRAKGARYADNRSAATALQRPMVAPPNGESR